MTWGTNNCLSASPRQRNDMISTTKWWKTPQSVQWVKLFLISLSRLFTVCGLSKQLQRKLVDWPWTRAVAAHARKMIQILFFMFCKKNKQKESYHLHEQVFTLQSCYCKVNMIILMNSPCVVEPVYYGQLVVYIVKNIWKIQMQDSTKDYMHSCRNVHNIHKPTWKKRSNLQDNSLMYISHVALVVM